MILHDDDRTEAHRTAPSHSSYQFNAREKRQLLPIPIYIPSTPLFKQALDCTMIQRSLASTLPVSERGFHLLAAAIQEGHEEDVNCPEEPRRRARVPILSSGSSQVSLVVSFRCHARFTHQMKKWPYGCTDQLDSAERGGLRRGGRYQRHTQLECNGMGRAEGVTARADELYSRGDVQ